MPCGRRPTKAEFLLAHPLCCFCGGRRPAVERDHAPARIVFRGKHCPDDFEFPACAECNRAMALSEQVTAFYIRSIDQTYDQLDAEEYGKPIRGIVNNAPEALPYHDRSRPPARSAQRRQFSTIVCPNAARRRPANIGRLPDRSDRVAETSGIRAGSCRSRPLRGKTHFGRLLPDAERRVVGLIRHSARFARCQLPARADIRTCVHLGSLNEQDWPF